MLKRDLSLRVGHAVEQHTGNNYLKEKKDTVKAMEVYVKRDVDRCVGIITSERLLRRKLILST